MTGDLRAEPAGQDRPPSRATSARVHRLVVRDGVRVVAEVEAARRRRRLRVAPDGPWGTRADASGHQEPDPLAWPSDSADRAARSRWGDLHPLLVTITAITAEAGSDGALPDPASVLRASGEALADLGFRRMDVRIRVDHPIAMSLQQAGWACGHLGDEVVLSTPLRYPWDRTEHLAAEAGLLADRLPRWLPLRLRRLGRRLLAVHPRRIPELVRVAGSEAAAAVRNRSVYRGARPARSHEAPDDAFPFAVTRYRTIRQTLSRIDASLRGTTFLDIGSGDGRVLAEAHSMGFTSVVGREVDSELATRSQAMLGARARVDVGDALATPIPADVGAVYLNNPFDTPSVERLADLVASSLADAPRPLVMIYINPRTIRPFTDAGLVLVDVAPQFTVLATGAG